MADLVPYYRVSTRKQGESGLGLEAQIASVNSYARTGAHNIIASYQEVETGKRSDRPQLRRALAHARRARAVLIIAKLDRIARNVHFLSGLMESKVDFVCCDMPSANPLTLHIMAAVAEDEAKRISARTKDAMAAYKARGGVLGTPANLTVEAGLKGARSTSAKARTAYAAIMPELRAWRNCGLSYQTIAELLNGAGAVTRTGMLWNSSQVRRVLVREGIM